MTIAMLGTGRLIMILSFVLERFDASPFEQLPRRVGRRWYY
jgi:hypothetical protein